ncbi:MAG: hypothetical protein HY961_03855 [Ignavibacteriae bacterium]|nr:hypothetical protein [Ignavibacteriota bacterium]
MSRFDYLCIGYVLLLLLLGFRDESDLTTELLSRKHVRGERILADEVIPQSDFQLVSSGAYFCRLRSSNPDAVRRDYQIRVNDPSTSCLLNESSLRPAGTALRIGQVQAKWMLMRK